MRLAKVLSGRILARIIAAGLQAILLILLAREMAPALFGVFAAAYGVGTLGASLLGFGSSTRILRAKAEADAALADGLFKLRMIGACFGALAGALCILWSPGAGAAVLLGVAFAASDAVIEFGQAYFASTESHAISAGIPVALRVGQVGTVAASAALSDNSVSYAVSICSILLAGGCIVILVRSMARQQTKTESGSSLLRALRGSAGYWFTGAVANVRQLEPIALLSAGSAALAGEYAIVTRVANPLLIVPASLQLIFVPRLASLLHERTKFDIEMRRLWVVSAIYAVLLVVSAPLIAMLLPLVLGSAYDGTFALTIAVVAAAGLSSLCYVVQIRFIAHGQPWRSSLWIAIYSLLGVGALAIIAAAGGTMIWTVPLATQTLLLATLLLVARRTPAHVSPE